MFRRIAFNTFAWLIVLMVAFPLFWMLVTSVKPQFELFRRPPTMLPETFTIGTLLAVVERDEFPWLFLELGNPIDNYNFRCPGYRNGWGLRPCPVPVQGPGNPRISGAVHLFAAFSCFDPSAVSDAGKPGPLEHHLITGHRPTRHLPCLTRCGCCARSWRAFQKIWSQPALVDGASRLGRILGRNPTSAFAWHHFDGVVHIHPVVERVPICSGSSEF